jgi:hypothetical protein
MVSMPSAVRKGKERKMVWVPIIGDRRLLEITGGLQELNSG